MQVTENTPTSSPPRPVEKSNSVGVENLPSGVAVISLGRPDEGAVSLTKERLFSFRAALAQTKDMKPKGLIITGPSASMFCVGADIKLIRDVVDQGVGTELARAGQDVFDYLSSLPFPTIAAISGPCVGGGYELALACTYRIASDEKSTLIGLPEVKIGILPGFGGSQRLPRLIGVTKALDVILNGKTLRAKQAHRMGLVNDVVPYAELLKRAEAVLLGVSSVKDPVISQQDKFFQKTSVGRFLLRRTVTAKLKRQTKGFYPAPPAALNAVLYGLEHGITQGLQFEAKEIGRLITSPESKALVKIFFLTENAKGIGKSAEKLVDGLTAVVIGAGTMGAGIASLLALKEHPVILKDTSDAALEKAMSQIKAGVGKLSYLSESEKSFVTNRIEATSRDSTNLGSAQIAIEAIIEDLGVKQKVLTSLAALMPDDAIIASNTSSLPITQLAKGIPNPSRVVGMHFFNPVDKMPLVEVIHGKETSNKTIAVTAALSTQLGKYSIVVADVPGFLVNRILTPYLNAASILLESGFSVSDIDNAAIAFGMPMGPLRLLDEVGLDVAAHVSAVMKEAYGERMAAPGFAKVLADAGRKGKKSGGGFYDFAKDKATPHKGLRALLKLPEEKGPSDKKFLQDALILSLINEAVRCLDEGVAGEPGEQAAFQVDLGTVMGMGFPPFRGGVIHYAQSLGADAILKRLKELETSLGNRFAPAEGIVKRAKSGASFYNAV